MKLRILMSASARIFLLLLACLTQFVPAVQAQPARTQLASRSERPGGATSRGPRVFFEEADGYVSTKLAESNQQKNPPDEKLVGAARQEQRQLAAKYVTELEARGPLAGNDLYYFGRLQYLAGKEDVALDSLRLYLAMTPDGDLAQLARAVAIRCAIKRKFIDEAEQIAAEYESNQPNDASQRFEIEGQLTSAFRSAADYERMATHAKVMYKLARQKLGSKACQAPQCEEMLVNATSLVAEAYQGQNRAEDAAGVMQRLRKLAVTKHSVALYTFAMGRSCALDRALDPFQTLDDTEGAETAPDLKAPDWIGTAPSKLSQLRGQVVLLEFWATWCGPCRASFADLRKWNTAYKEKGLTIIGATTTYGQVEGRKMSRAEELDYLREFRKKNELGYVFAVDEAFADGLNYGVFGIPSYVLIDRRGFVRSMGMGTGSGLERMIKKLIEEPAPTPETLKQ